MTALVKTLNNIGINNFVVVDVGAKGKIESIQGVESISEIHAFEPNPEEYNALQKVYLMHPFKQLNLNCLGLSDDIGKSAFMISKNSAMSSLLQPDFENYKKHFGNYKAYNHWAASIDTIKRIEISLETIDHYFNTNSSIDFLKLDTQGSELTILKGAIKTLEKGLIKVLKVEVSTVTTYHNQTYFSDIDIFLRKYNYGLIDFITYKDNPSYILGEDANIHSAPCGDAIYYYTPDYDDEKENIKKSVIINRLGYPSLAINILEATQIKASLKNELITNSKKKNNHIWKGIARDLLPPVLIKILKKI
jgi:FkbM family methyltransferase